MHRSLICFLVASLLCTTTMAAEWGMKSGNPKLKSAGPLAFGDHGVLFVGDPIGATVCAISTQHVDSDADEVELHLHGIDKAVAKKLGTEKVAINDLAVDPESGVAYLSVSAGEEKSPGLVRVMPNGDLEVVSLENVDYSKVELPNAPEDKTVGAGRRRQNYRGQSITDLAFSEGQVLVSGVSGQGRAANLRELIFPFMEADKGVNIEIYHGAHGKYENTSTVKTFVPFKIDGEPYLLAGFTCTPLVKFPINQIKKADSIRGTTVAELGNHNQPLDMIIYKQSGKDFLLLSNSARGVMKISTEDVERAEGITERVRGTAGQTFETIESLNGVEQMDKLNSAHALVIARNGEALDLHTVDLP